MTASSKSTPPEITVQEIVERTATAALNLQREDGSFPPGKNFVYDDPETPVRSTSSWLLTLTRAYEINENGRFFEAANAAADYLLGDDHRPYGHTYLARDSDDRDRCNGLIGQAKVIKNMARVSETLERPELVDEAHEIFDLHPFNPLLGLWERVEIDGSHISFDRTINHQLIFAASASNLMGEVKGVEPTIRSFLNKLLDNLDVHQSGRIRHYIRPPMKRSVRIAMSTHRHWILLWNELVIHYHARSSQRRRKEIGYHAVNLGPLATLKRRLPEHPVWESSSIKKAVDYARSTEYKSRLENGTFTFGNMNPGLRLARAFIEFGDEDLAKRWLAYAIFNKYDFEKDLYSLKSPDPMFQAASIVHVVDLPNWTLRDPGGPP